jgi:hypothetical protein
MERVSVLFVPNNLKLNDSSGSVSASCDARFSVSYEITDAQIQFLNGRDVRFSDPEVSSIRCRSTPMMGVRFVGNPG